MSVKHFEISNHFTKLALLQEERTTNYSVTDNDGQSCVIKIINTSEEYSKIEEFYCTSNYSDCVNLVIFLKENCICPGQCKDISMDLGYCVQA